MQDPDPHFIFRFRLFSAKYLVIEVASSEYALEPCFYLDTGHGFRPEYEVALPATQHGVYVIRNFSGIRRVRFDPCPDHGSFTLLVRTARSLKAAKASGGPSAANLHVIDGREQAKAPPPRRAESPGERFDRLVELANVQHVQRRDEESISAVPLLSFVAPIHNTPPHYLDALLQSFVSQRADNWELLLCDDGSTRGATLAWLSRHERHSGVRILRNSRNSGIASATNLGVFTARGEWVGLIDHDDALAPFAIECLNQAIVQHPKAAFIYTDELITDAKLTPTGYFFKPAFDPVLLSGVNYINHLSLYRRERLVEMGGLKPGYDGSQDYELVLRYLSGLPAASIVHLPYPAYLWRRDGASYSASFAGLAAANARRALGEAYGNHGNACPVGPALVPDLHRLRFDQRRDSWPLVSVVIPNRDSFDLINRLLADLTQRTDYPTLEIIIVDNGTTDPRVLQLYDQFRQSHENFHVDLTVEPFNFARQTNRGLRRARGEALLLLNNDIEVQRSDWLKEMVSCLEYKDAGIVGARLLYPSGRLQHAGVIVGLGGLAGHWYGHSSATAPGPMNRLQVRQSFSAVTGACMLISRQCYEAAGELDEQAFAIAYNDVDYCLRAALAGFRTVWTPFATLVHHESATRGSDETIANRDRFQREKNALRKKYRTDILNDPAFSPWYSRHYSVPREIIPENLPTARNWTAAPVVNTAATDK